MNPANATQVLADSFAFYIHWDQDEPTVAVHIVGAEGANLLLPLDLTTAESLGTVLLSHVSALTSIQQGEHV